MALNQALEAVPWKVGDASSELLLSVAASKPVRLDRPLSEEQLELAIHHGLFGLMADHDNPHLRNPAIPVFARLEARHSVMRSHLRPILTLLHESGVQATVLKGFQLAAWAYSNPMHRTTTDVDLLVPANQVDRAIEVLAEYEYVQTIPAKTPKADKRNIPIGDPTGVRFTLDLHWDLFSYSQLRGCAAGATDWAWQQATFVEDHPLGPMWELPEAARIAFLCTHALLDHRFRLILFRDLAEVAATKPDWVSLVSFAHRWQLRSTTYLALLMAVGLFEADIPREALQALRKRSLPVLVSEQLLRRADLVQFDGHRAHPLNLAIVLVHDDVRDRARLLMQAPAAFPGWQARVAQGDQAVGRPKPATAAPVVLHLLPVDLARGAQTYAKALCAALEDHRARHLTMTIFRSEDDPLETDLSLDVMPGRGRRFGFDVRAAFELRRALRKMKPAIIVAHGGEPLKYVAVVAPRRSKLVYYKIGKAAGRFKSEMRRRLYSLMLRRVDVLAGVSREMVEEAETLQNVPAKRTIYIPNGRE
ncbi:MAG: glycosyltransferase, partial [Acidimicrobiia bacterium]|nr:glycosyltransferase [Acidimicrobiia bacterium]